MTKKNAIDPFYDILDKNYKKGERKFSKAKGVKAKTDLAMTNYADSLSEYFNKIAKMDQLDYEKLLENRVNSVMSINEKIFNKTIKNMASSKNMRNDDIGMIASLPEIIRDGNFVDKVSSHTWELVSQPSTLERLFVLEILNRFEHLAGFALDELNLEPLNRLQNIITTRFGADLNWAIAIAILAVHENLIKKKLLNLQIPEEAIQQIEKEKKFSGLVDLLRSKMENANQKNVSLFFHKSSTLREIRNKLEHHGYKQTVSNEEVLELLNDLEKFEKVLFKKMFNPGDRVIVIDDSKKIVSVVKDLLSMAGVEVIAVGYNGNDAIRLYKKFKPDLMIIDLMMPKKDGFEAIKEIFKNHPDAKIIVLTGAHVKPIESKLLKSGVLNIIHKPFSVNTLLEGDHPAHQ